MKSLQALLYFALVVGVANCSSRKPVNIIDKEGGDASGALATVQINIENLDEMEADAGGELTGYRVVVQRMEGSICAVATKVDRIGRWAERELSEKLITSCDYSILLEVGTLKEDGSGLDKIYYANWNADNRRGSSVLATDIAPGKTYEITKALYRLRGSDGGPTAPGEDPVSDTPQDLPPKMRDVIGYYVNWDMPTNLSQASLEAYGKHLTMLAPLWYQITTTGTVVTAYNGPIQAAIDQAKAKGLRLIPLINNQAENATFVTDAAVRTAAIDNLVALATAQSFDGINVSFNNIPSTSKDALSDFVTRLAEKLHAANKVLVVSAPPKVDIPETVHGAYDYAVLGAHADRVQLRTNDKYNPGTGPGPVTPISWMESNIQHALDNGIAPEKLIVALASYGYDWPASGAVKAVGEKEAIALADANKAEMLWDSVNKVPYFTYTAAGVAHTVYFESSYSNEEKLKVINKYDIKGVSLWRMGTETARLWEIINQSFEQGTRIQP